MKSFFKIVSLLILGVIIAADARSALRHGSHLLAPAIRRAAIARAQPLLSITNTPLSQVARRFATSSKPPSGPGEKNVWPLLQSKSSSFRAVAAAAAALGGGAFAFHYLPDEYKQFGSSEPDATTSVDDSRPRVLEYQRYSDYLKYEEFESMMDAFEKMPLDDFGRPCAWPGGVQRLAYLHEFANQRLNDKWLAERTAQRELLDSIALQNANNADEQSSGPLRKGWKNVKKIFKNGDQPSGVVAGISKSVNPPAVVSFEESFRKDGDRGSNLCKLTNLIQVLDTQMHDNHDLRKSQKYLRRRDDVVRAARRSAASHIWS